jgi:radical SAM superfamily enzyme YgiQ (UPF0313 family)
LYNLNKDFEGLEWKEFTINEDRENIAEHCQQFDIVAFSCYIWNITQTLEVARKIKVLNPNTKILLGGPEVSYDWEDVICLPEVDFIITGEGETPFAEFLHNYPNIENVPNLVRKVGEETLATKEAPQFNLTAYTDIMPYLYDAPEDLRNKVLYIETSRGCPYKCEFCLASLDNKVRYLPNESIKNMLLYLMQNGRVIKFLDRTFNIKRDFTIDIFTFILANYRPENVFQFEITADILHPDIIKFIDENVPVGLFRFEIGIQTVNQKANLAVQRRQSFDKTTRIIKQLEHKVEMHLDLIVGMALDYWEDIRYSFEEVFKLFAPELQLGFLKFLKGTPVRHKAEQHGFIYDPNPPYQIIESKYLSREELAKIELLEHALEIYWNKKRTIRTLKYVTANYSIFDFLAGLGQYFSERKNLHKYLLTDVYEILLQFSAENYPEDTILPHLINLDFFLFHKIKPKGIILPEMDKKRKNKIVEDLRLNPQKFRYVMLELPFDFVTFEQENLIKEGNSLVIIQYTGTDKPKILDLQLEKNDIYL